MNRAKSLKR